MVTWSPTGPVAAWLDGVSGTATRLADAAACPLAASSWPLAGFSASALYLGNGPAGLEVGGAGDAWVLGDVQLYGGVMPVPLFVASPETRPPPPPWAAPAARARLAACPNSTHRYGAGGAYPVTGGVAVDFGTSEDVDRTPGSLVRSQSARSADDVLSFDEATTLSLGPADMNWWPGFTLLLMSDSALCTPARLLDFGGYTVEIIGDCKSGGVVVVAPNGETVTLRSAAPLFGGGLPTRRPYTYVGLVLDPYASAVTVYAGGRPWATAPLAWLGVAGAPFTSTPVERNDVYGWGTLLDVQIYSRVLSPMSMRELALGKQNCD